MTQRTVKKLIYAQEIEMGDIPIRQPLPAAGIDYIDPFLLLHHHRSEIQAGSNYKDIGVGPHPHRGFSPVTIIYQGDVHHRDSRGNSEVVKQGGVQWMNAGMGIVHSERPSAQFALTGGIQEIIQLWVNTPASHKMDMPQYFSINSEQIPLITSDDKKTKVRVIAGDYQHQKGFDNTFSKVVILDIQMSAGAKYDFAIPEGYTLSIYNLDNRIRIESFGIVDGYYLALFNNDGKMVTITSDSNTRMLLLAGEPLNEPVQTYGPFVMSNQTEIMQAIKDYQMGKMGVLIEDDMQSAL